jgi:glycosyltransferase involved in cell wall biosynthesis
MLQRADVVWCEWLLGNAVHYARNKRPGQLLIVRLHHQEMELSFRHQIEWSAVDALLITCYQHYDRLRAELPDVRDRIHLVPQLLTCDRFDRPKHDGAQFNLGLLGMAPFRKRPDLAIDLVEELRRHDSRYSLSVKSRHPWEYGWLWERPEEREAYEELYERLRGMPGVHFEAHGADVDAWFRRIGYLVSTSDHEGSHQAVAEGMASGAVPILRNWDGADRLYPERFVFKETSEAVERVLAQQARFEEESEECRAFARAHFDAPTVWQQMDELFSGAMASACQGSR